eukprot:3088744-Rhodomonas_salina.1
MGLAEAGKHLSAWGALPSVGTWNHLNATTSWNPITQEQGRAAPQRGTVRLWLHRQQQWAQTQREEKNGPRRRTTSWPKPKLRSVVFSPLAVMFLLWDSVSMGSVGEGRRCSLMQRGGHSSETTGSRFRCG